MTRTVVFASLAAALVLGGCAVRPTEIGHEPVLTPVGAGIGAETAPPNIPGTPEPRTAFNSLYHDGDSLYRDNRAMKAGDLLTITVQMDDKAVLGNNTDRSLDSKVTNAFNFGLGGGNIAGGFKSADKSEANGQGSIDRSEKIKFSVAAIVTQVLPNGYLLVSGAQEVRVNYEIRQVYVAGIVRPRDISKENTIPYEKVAEARISYGGRGRLMEVQQPAWGQQVYDIIKPF